MASGRAGERAFLRFNLSAKSLGEHVLFGRLQHVNPFERSIALGNVGGELDIPEDELLEHAFWKGIRQLRRERVGREWVVAAEKQRDAMNEDLEWALQ